MMIRNELEQFKISVQMGCKDQHSLNNLIWSEEVFVLNDLRSKVKGSNPTTLASLSLRNSINDDLKSTKKNIFIHFDFFVH